MNTTLTILTLTAVVEASEPPGEGAVLNVEIGDNDGNNRSTVLEVNVICRFTLTTLLSKSSGVWKPIFISNLGRQIEIRILEVALALVEPSAESIDKRLIFDQHGIETTTNR